MAKSRWAIENRGFNTGKTHYRSTSVRVAPAITRPRAIQPHSATPQFGPR